jgi:hypothetical protein
MRTLVASWAVGWAGCWLLAGGVAGGWVAGWAVAGWVAMFVACGLLLTRQYQNLVRRSYAECIEENS